MEFIKSNWATIMAVLAYIGTAAISTMPPKDADWNAKTVYGWFFDFTHMLLNMRPSPQQENREAHIVTSQQTADVSTKTDATFHVGALPSNPTLPATPANQEP